MTLINITYRNAKIQTSIEHLVNWTTAHSGAAQYLRKYTIEKDDLIISLTGRISDPYIAICRVTHVDPKSKRVHGMYYGSHLFLKCFEKKQTTVGCDIKNIRVLYSMSLGKFLI